VNVLPKKAKREKTASIHMNRHWCKGCYICLEVCPKKVFEKSPEIGEKGFNPIVIAHPEQCSCCRQCELLCPDLALQVVKEG
jgi:2-oxoglutarate ferredoxin oxidoreductase subunit delta